MRWFATLLAAFSALMAVPASAQVLSVETWIEEQNPITGEWVRVKPGAERFVATPISRIPASIATYGPFRVIDGQHAALVDATDTASPHHFAALLRDYPEIATLQLIECPGTDDDKANMAVGRMIRDAGIATHVPRGGSVRSGAVELFLAGVTRRVDDGAQFAVHSWRDDLGREAGDYAMSDPANAAYLSYYQEMGMPQETARAFYDMTNSVPHADAMWLTAQDMRGWLEAQPDIPGVLMEDQPRLAYLDIADLSGQNLDSVAMTF